ncbi:MAG: hypothetical protein NBV67_02840 [Tagaea sp.]|nr:hypothetical protein [Tagaea sp.]
MAFESCIAAVREASGGKLSDQEAEALIAKIDRKKRAAEAAGAIDGADARLAQAAREAADEAVIEQALAAKHKALAVLKRADLDARLDVLAPKLGERDAILALFEGTTRMVDGGRHSVAAIKLSLERRFLGEPLAKIAAERPHIERLIRDENFLDDVVREMAKTGITRNADAAFAAKAFAESFEASRQALNARGANIGKLEGWAGPQIHDDAKIRNAGPDAWVRATIDRLDIQRSFPGATPEEVPGILREVWTNIVTGRDRVETAAGRGDFTGPANLARSLERHRVLHFKDAEAWLDYRRDFASGHAFDAFAAHQHRAARAGALMDVFGPNPENMLAQVVDAAQLRVRKDTARDPAKAQAMIQKLDADRGILRHAIDEASGATLIPVHHSAAKIGAGIRAVQSMAKLGGAVISSASDLIAKAVGLRVNGVSLGEAYAGQFRELLAGRGTGQAREIAFLTGEGFDGIIGHVVSPYVAGDTLPGAMARGMEKFFRWSGLTWWTDANKAGMSRMLSAHLGSKVGLDHARLPGELGRVLAGHGIGALEWNALRQAAFRMDANGRTYVTPDRVRALPDDAIAPLVEGRVTARKIAEARDALELKVGAYFGDQVGFGMLEADAATRRVMYQGYAPGTPLGEAARFIMQFKGFPIAFGQRVLGRAANFAEGETVAQRLLNNSGTIAHVIAGTFVAGYASMTAKDYLAGYTERDPTSYKTILAALKQGGGLGIYGDFLFGEANRFGGGLLETLAGPGATTASDIGRLVLLARDGDLKSGQTLNLILQNTPYANLWYARPVMDGLVLNSLREALSPGFLARQERRRMEDFGQMRARDPEWLR